MAVITEYDVEDKLVLIPPPVLPVPEPQEDVVADICHKAANYIAYNGWIQNVGNENGRVCMLYAVDTQVEELYPREERYDIHQNVYVDVAERLAIKLFGHSNRSDREEQDAMNLIMWNDHPARKASEVISLLRSV